MKILVTGAAGFIGSHIANALHARGHAVIGVDDLSGALDWHNLKASSETYRGFIPSANYFARSTRDCANYEEMRSIFDIVHINDGAPFDVVVNCAANAREGASQFQPYSIAQRNLQLASNVLSHGLRTGCKRYVMFSSMAVYGAQTPPFSEDLPLEPEDVYGVNKMAMERVTKILCETHGASYAIIRPHNVFGENQALFDKHRNVIGIFMNRIMRGEPLFIYGDGEQTRAFSYIGDSLPSFIKVIEGVGVVPELTNMEINIGGVEPVTVNALASIVKREMGVDTSYPTEYHIDRPREVKHAFTTYEKSVDLLGYSERIGWIAGVAAMAQWARARGPVDWMNKEKLEIISDLVPIPWRG